jgi:hypothetical protein
VIRLVTRPLLLISTFLAILAAIVALFVSRRKDLREAFRMYRHYLKTFIGIGAFTIPIGIIFNGLAILVRENPPMEWVIKWFNDTAGARLTAAALVGGVQQIAMLLVIAPPVIQALKDLRAGQTPSVGRSFRLGYRHLGSLVVGLAIDIAVIAVLVLTLIGIPVAIWLGVSWQFFGQAIILDEVTSGTVALRSLVARAPRFAGLPVVCPGPWSAGRGALDALRQGDRGLRECVQQYRLRLHGPDRDHRSLARLPPVPGTGCPRR